MNVLLLRAVLVVTEVEFRNVASFRAGAAILDAGANDDEDNGIEAGQRR